MFLYSWSIFLTPAWVVISACADVSIACIKKWRVGYEVFRTFLTLNIRELVFEEINGLRLPGCCVTKFRSDGGCEQSKIAVASVSCTICTMSNRSLFIFRSARQYLANTNTRQPVAQAGVRSFGRFPRFKTCTVCAIIFPPYGQDSEFPVSDCFCVLLPSNNSTGEDGRRAGLG